MFFKKPDYEDNIQRYLLDQWYEDFWIKTTWIGKILMAPVGIILLFIILCIIYPICFMYKISVKK